MYDVNHEYIQKAKFGNHHGSDQAGDCLWDIAETQYPDKEKLVVIPPIFYDLPRKAGCDE
jgi:hypothetical protein